MLLVVNPQARHGQNSMDEALRVFESRGVELVIDREHPLDAALAHAGHVDGIILAGGDGTLHDAAPVLLRTGVPVGILPRGTANDFARSLDIPSDLADAASIIADGTIRGVDVGDVNGEPFFNVAHVGLGAELDDELDDNVKQRWGAFAYGVAAARTLRKLPAFGATIVVNGKSFTLRTTGITVGNGRYFGGSGIVAADAEVDDGVLRLFAIRPSSSFEWIEIALRVLVGRHHEARGVFSKVGTEIEIRTRRPMRIRADGQVLGETPARLRILPHALRFFAPPPAARAEASEPEPLASNTAAP